MSSYFEQAWSFSNETSFNVNVPGLTWYVHWCCWYSIAWDNKISNRLGGNMISGGRYSNWNEHCWWTKIRLSVTLQFLHQIFSRSKTFSTPIRRFVHIFQWIEHEETKRCRREISNEDEDDKDEITLLIDAFDRFECSRIGFHFVNNWAQPSVDHLRSIQNIFVRELNISFAKRRRWNRRFKRPASLYLKSIGFFDKFFQSIECN